MEHQRTIKAGKAEIEFTLKELTFKMGSLLDDMTSDLFFESGRGRQGTNLQLGRIKDIVIWNSVKTTKRTQKDGTEKVVRFKHPDYQGGNPQEIRLADPDTLDNFPIINSDVEYMSKLDRAFMERIVEDNGWIAERWPTLFGRFLPQDEQEAQAEAAENASEAGEEEAQAVRNPTLSDGAGTSESPEPEDAEGTSTKVGSFG